MTLLPTLYKMCSTTPLSIECASLLSGFALPILVFSLDVYNTFYIQGEFLIITRKDCSVRSPSRTRARCLRIGVLEESCNNPFNSPISQIWLQRVTEVARQIRASALRATRRDIKLNIAFRGVPVALAFAAGYLLGALPSASVLQWPRGYGEWHLVYRFSVSKNTAPSSIQFSSYRLRLRCDRELRRALIIVATRDNISPFFNGVIDSSSIAQSLQRYACDLFDEILVYVIEELKGRLYVAYGVDELEALIERLVARARHDIADYAEFSIILLGVEAGFAFVLGAQLDKQPSLKYVLHYSSVRRCIGAAIDVRSLDLTRISTL